MKRPLLWLPLLTLFLPLTPGMGQEKGIDLLTEEVELELDPALEEEEAEPVGEEEAAEEGPGLTLEVKAEEKKVITLKVGAEAAQAESDDAEAAPEPPEKPKKKQPAITPDEIEDMLAGADMFIEPFMEQAMDGPYRKIKKHLKLDKERLEKLKQGASLAAKAMAEEWREEMREKIPDLSKSQRERLAMGRPPTQPEPKPEASEIWQKIVGNLITEEEQEMVKVGAAAARERRKTALMGVLVTELDRHLGLSQPQREQLVVVGAPLLDDLDRSYFESPPNGYAYVNLPSVFQVLKEEATLMAVLDEPQKALWEKLEPNALQPNHGRSSHRLADGELPEVTDPVEAEILVGRLLFKAAQQERKHQHKKLMDELNLITRISGADETRMEALRTLAKGKAEEASLYQNQQMAQYIGRQIRNVAPLKRPERMRQMHAPNFSRGRNQEKGEDALWAQALKTVLTEPQHQTLEQYRSEAEAWRLRSMASLILTEVEKWVDVPPLVRESLQERMMTVISEFDAAFESTFSRGWHLQGYYCCIPLELIESGDEDEGLEDLFDEDAMSTLRGHPLAHTAQYVDQLRRQRSKKTGILKLFK